MNEKLDNISKAIDIAIKADAHAFALILLGALVAFKMHDIGSGLVMTGLGIFKGRS